MATGHRILWFWSVNETYFIFNLEKYNFCYLIES